VRKRGVFLLGNAPSPSPLVIPERGTVTRKFYAVEVVRQIEETVEIMVEAPDQTAAHDAALAHLKARGSEYQWLNPKCDLVVWRERQVDTPAIIDVSVSPD
jgi:hypothetical protein